MKKIKTLTALTLILALAIPLFLMPISAAEEEPNIDELIEMTKESELFLDIIPLYQEMVGRSPGQKFTSYELEVIDKAKEWGYYDPEFDTGGMYHPYSAIDYKTGEIMEGLDLGYGYRFPDSVTIEKIESDIEKYFVSDFLEILDCPTKSATCYAFLAPDGHVYNHWYGQFSLYGSFANPDFEDPKIIEKSDKKITLGFNTVGYKSESYDDVTIEYRKTSRGWRISGATGTYYKTYESIFASEVPETADNSVVYIALASVSVIALAGITFVSAKRKKAYIA